MSVKNYTVRFMSRSNYDNLTSPSTYNWITDTYGYVEEIGGTGIKYMKTYQLKFSAREYSDDMFASLPKPTRATFRLPKNTWINTNIIADTYDVQNEGGDMAGFVCAVFEDSTMIFVGIPNALSSYTKKTEWVEFTAYDFLSLVISKIQSKYIYLGSDSGNIENVTSITEGDSGKVRIEKAGHGITDADIDAGLSIYLYNSGKYTSGTYEILKVSGSSHFDINLSYTADEGSIAKYYKKGGSFSTVDDLIEEILKYASELFFGAHQIDFDYDISINDNPDEGTDVYDTNWDVTDNSGGDGTATGFADDPSYDDFERNIGFVDKNGTIYLCVYAKDTDTSDQGRLRWNAVKFVGASYSLSEDDDIDGLTNAEAEQELELKEDNFPGLAYDSAIIYGTTAYELKNSNADVYYGVEVVFDYILWNFGKYNIKDILEVVLYINQAFIYVDSNGKIWVKDKNTTSTTLSALTDANSANAKIKSIRKRSDPPDLSIISKAGRSSTLTYPNWNVITDVINNRYDDLFGTTDRELDVEIFPSYTDFSSLDLLKKFSYNSTNWRIYSILNDVKKNTKKIKAYKV